MWSRGDIVWAKINDVWWPGMVDKPDDCDPDTVGENKVLVSWFVRLENSKMESGDLLDFKQHFAEKCVQSWKKPFKTAVLKALSMLAFRLNCKETDPGMLHKWAYSGFQTGVDVSPIELPMFALHNSEKKCAKPKKKKRHAEEVDKIQLPNTVLHNTEKKCTKRKKRHAEEVDKIQLPNTVLHNTEKKCTKKKKKGLSKKKIKTAEEERLADEKMAHQRSGESSFEERNIRATIYFKVITSVPCTPESRSASPPDIYHSLNGNLF
ncbi:hypothetical protein CEXT_362221 [Caerostris extrusa]|uniref:PWWP domain-containing protein n=1 Tax=Caerostris extrusa TaxID=172846 RepID=A0AAV4NEZ0_CAEEX|nr:hypothetical protein CEXT_362221 [Caerostris extrusa]